MASEKVFGEGFGAFELRSGGVWPEAGQACGIKSIDNTRDKRRLRSDDCQINILSLSKCEQGIDIIGADGDVTNAGLASGTGITRRNKNFINIGGLSTFPGKRMLPTTRPNNQYPHGDDVTCCGGLWLGLTGQTVTGVQAGISVENASFR